MTEVLSLVQLKRLKDHQYKSENVSLLDPPMQVFWKWLVEQVPTWCAPNAITLAGLIINIATAVILIWYSPDARQEPPSWALVLCGVGLFFYQALDAIDGKQARRTNNSSPLGELFDHGCDAVSTVVVAVSFCIGIQLGSHPSWMFYQCFSAMTMFYVAHWQTYVSGMLKFGKFDVTEAQICIMITFLTSAVMGVTFWENKIPFFGEFNLKQGYVIFCTVLASISVIPTMRVIFVQGGIGRNGSTVAGTSVVYPIFPLIVMLALPVMISQKSETNIYQHHPCLFILAFGLSFCKITIKLVVAHMTKSELDLLDSVLLGPGMLFLNQYMNTILNEYIVLWMCFFYCLIDVLRYSATVCVEICDFLEIFCFKITVPEENGSGPKSTALGEARGPILRARKS